MKLLGHYNKILNDVAAFHEVMNSILQILDDTIHIIADVGPIDLSNDTNCSATFSDQQKLSDDSGHGPGQSGNVNDELVDISK